MQVGLQNHSKTRTARAPQIVLPLKVRGADLQRLSCRIRNRVAEKYPGQNEEQRHRGNEQIDDFAHKGARQSAKSLLMAISLPLDATYGVLRGLLLACIM